MFIRVVLELLNELELKLLAYFITYFSTGV